MCAVTFSIFVEKFPPQSQFFTVFEMTNHLPIDQNQMGLCALKGDNLGTLEKHKSNLQSIDLDFGEFCTIISLARVNHNCFSTPTSTSGK
jgi:hypothetical protein